MKIVLASRNRKKIGELKAILSKHFAEIEILSLDDVGIFDEIEENGQTFEENALIKARVAATSGMIGVGDDSGLTVEYLGGEPGIYSARYAARCNYAGDHNDAANNEVLLQKLNGVPTEQRSAAFVCTIACVIPEGQPLSGDPIIGTGYCPGEILFNPRGNSGFGYDPLFWFDPFGKTFAEMSAEEKNAISHRGAAVRSFAAAFNARIAEEKEKLWKRYGL